MNNPIAQDSFTKPGIGSAEMTAKTAHEEPDLGPADDGTVGLVIGIVALTVLAGMIEVVRRLRGGESWPVPLVIYATLLPIVLFLLIGATMAGERIDFAYAVLIPLPLLALAWQVDRKRTARVA